MIKTIHQNVMLTLKIIWCLLCMCYTHSRQGYVTLILKLLQIRWYITTAQTGQSSIGPVNHRATAVHQDQCILLLCRTGEAHLNHLQFRHQI